MLRSQEVDALSSSPSLASAPLSPNTKLLLLNFFFRILTCFISRGLKLLCNTYALGTGEFSSLMWRDALVRLENGTLAESRRLDFLFNKPKSARLAENITLKK